MLALEDANPLAHLLPLTDSPLVRLNEPCSIPMSSARLAEYNLFQWLELGVMSILYSEEEGLTSAATFVRRHSIEIESYWAVKRMGAEHESASG